MPGIKWQPLAEKSVTTAGTRVQINSGSIPTAGIQIQAAEGNTTKLIYVGLSDVSATKYIVCLGAGEVWSTSNSEMRDQEFDLSDYYIDSDANAQKCYVSYLAKR
jgi:hypothetical protein